MKYNKIFGGLALSIIAALLLVVSPTVPIHAAEAYFNLSLNEGKIGDWIAVEGYGFDASKTTRIYFSSDRATKGDSIDGEVTAYQYLGTAFTDTSGNFDPPYSFVIPDELADGADKEDVHGGDYYVYATYFTTKRIEAVAMFTVIGGEIEIDPEEGPVGNEVEISGEGFRGGQKIEIEFDGDYVDIARGDEQTDNEGKFICVIIIPESPSGDYKITAADESGNKPEVEFRVKPNITITPTSQIKGKEVAFSGTGFGEGEHITITLSGDEIATIPVYLRANRRGSFDGSFVVPVLPSSNGNGTGTVTASDESFNIAKTQLVILATPADISLSPVTSLTSPGHVGMELDVHGIGFIAQTAVTITYNGNGASTIATATTNNNGNFWASFTVPPSTAGSHTITSTDGTYTAISIFTMESEVPPVPVPRLPEVASTAESKTYFDWGDVTDPSGVSYILQIALDSDFTHMVLEKKGLPDSEYTITEDEKPALAGEETPFYWRVRAVDGASNESEWTLPRLFYIGSSGTSAWNLYVWIGLGVVLIVALAFWVRKVIRSR